MHVHMLTLSSMLMINVPYSGKQWQGKTLANQSFQSFGEENIGEFNLLTNSSFIGSVIWQGKILTNYVRFAKFAKVFSHHRFALYGILSSSTLHFTLCTSCEIIQQGLIREIIQQGLIPHHKFYNR